MFFLLRVAFWLTIVLALLPSGGAQQSAQAKVGPTEAVVAAGAAVSDMSSFCDRQPEACVVGAQAAVAIGQRAQAGAKMVYDFINDHASHSGETGSVNKPKRGAKARKCPHGSRLPGSQSTLKDSDLDAGLAGPDRRGRKTFRCRARRRTARLDLGKAFCFDLRRGRPYIKGMAQSSIDEIIENFDLLEEWDDRYRYLIELGRTLPPLPEAARSDANKVQGCASQVWLSTTVKPNGSTGPVLAFDGDSDAHIVRGLIAILFALYSGKGAKDILSTDAVALFEKLGLRDHLTPQRSNGFRSMVDRIRRDANTRSRR